MTVPPGRPRTERERHRRGRDDREDDEPPDDEQPMAAASAPARRFRPARFARRRASPGPRWRRARCSRRAAAGRSRRRCCPACVLRIEVVERTQEELPLLLLGLARVLVGVGHARPRSSATSASSAADAVRLGSRCQRRSAMARPPAPRTSAAIGQGPDEHTDPVAGRLQQHGLAVPLHVDLADLGVALAPPDALADVGARRPGRLRRAVRDREPLAVDAANLGGDAAGVRALSDSSPPRGHDA